MKPRFIIIGAQRAGTTSFYHLLCEHPCVLPAATKEVHYFDCNYSRGPGWYESQFPLAAAHSLGRQAITGEASPYYLFHPCAMARLAQDLPEARLIVLLRNPIERAYSHYHHQRRRKLETLSFEEALAQEDERLRGEAEKILQDENYNSANYRGFSYLARGIYEEQLRAVRDLFPGEQTLVLRSEDFFISPEQILAQTLSFLNLPDWRPRKFIRQNAGKYSGMSPQIREFLRDYFEPHNQRLYEFLSRDFGWK